MRERPGNPATRAPQVEPPECFAEFEVPDEPARACTDDSGNEEDDTVQVTVLLRGRRTELENPALALAQLAMRTLQTTGGDSGNDNARDQGVVIDSVGVAVEPAWAR